MCISVSIKGMICLVVLDRSYLNYQVSKKKKTKQNKTKTKQTKTNKTNKKNGTLVYKLFLYKRRQNGQKITDVNKPEDVSFKMVIK